MNWWYWVIPRASDGRVFHKMDPRAVGRSWPALEADLGTRRTKLRCRKGFFRKVCPVLDRNGRLSVYKGFIRPTMGYAPLVWQGATRSKLANLDHIQQRCMCNVGAGTMLPSLSVRRQVSGLCYLFKLHYISGPGQLTDMLRPPAAPEPARPRTRHQHQAKHSHAFQLFFILWASKG